MRPKRPKSQVPAPDQDTRDNTATSDQFKIPLELQQQLLNVFKLSLNLSNQTELQPVIQEVKGHLYNRDFKAAFGKQAYLEAYAGRWSPSRSLAYTEILNRPEVQSLWYDNDRTALITPKKVTCIGGGAGAEVVALAGLTRLRGRAKIAEVAVVDSADWSDVLGKLEQALTSSSSLSFPSDHAVVAEQAPTSLSSPPPSSNHAPTAAAAAPVPASTLPPSSPLPSLSSPSPSPFSFSPPSLTFHHADILLSPPSPSLQHLLRSTHLITLTFTLNELFSTSVPRTTQLLLNVTDLVAPGTMLLVVDSPGSYSEVVLGKGKRGEEEGTTRKRYPMDWLLDHVLLEVTKERGREGGLWEKVVGEGSRWFRVSEKLEYPLVLENMRYQMHLFRRVGKSE